MSPALQADSLLFKPPGKPVLVSAWYGLNVCVPPTPKQYVKTLIPSWDIWEVGRVRLGHEDGIMGLVPFRKKRERHKSSLSVWMNQGKP